MHLWLAGGCRGVDLLAERRERDPKGVECPKADSHSLEQTLTL
ncbi:MAG TPA: hypothetical protein VLV86_07555 [Vicinamibacterales bacterium]|nr:hypothetical protein [Vicinamibacterales bacterium]